jgi:large subunit ribosomal protein L18
VQQSKLEAVLPIMQLNKEQKRNRRHLRIRKKISGDGERPRLCVHKSNRHIYAQLVDDLTGRTLLLATSNRKEFKGEKKSFCTVAVAKQLGKELGEQAMAKGIAKVVFDRGGFLYHGCIKALAEAARETGLKF